MSSPDIRPPVTPFLTTPKTNDTCVEDGPGRHCDSAKNSRNTAVVTQFSFSTNICQHPFQITAAPFD